LGVREFGEHQKSCVSWYDYGARFYDPQLGRFHTQDPLAVFYPGMSPYGYAYDNPVGFADFYGMGPIDWFKDLFKKKKHLPFAPGKRKYKPAKGRRGKSRSRSSRRSKPSNKPSPSGSAAPRYPVAEMPDFSFTGPELSINHRTGILDMPEDTWTPAPPITVPVAPVKPKSRESVTGRRSFYGDQIFTPGYASINSGDAWDNWLLKIAITMRRNSNVNLNITISTNLADGTSAKGSGLTGRQLVDERTNKLRDYMEGVYGIPGARLHFNKGVTGAEKNVTVEIRR